MIPSSSFGQGSHNHWGQKTLVISVATLLGQLTQQAVANPANAPLPEVTLQAIVVTATPSNYQQKAKIDTQDDTLASQASHLSNFLETVPGVTVGGTSTLDQRIYVRGVDDNELKVTIDGARQENYFFHHAGSVAIDTDLLKSAEVAVGNNSVTLGNRALGGAVAFTTVDASDLLQPDQKIGTKLKLGYNSNDKQRHSTATVFAQPTEDTDVLLSYGQRNSDGGQDGHGKHIQGKDITIDNMLAKFSYRPTDTQKLTLSYQLYQDEGQYPFRPNTGGGLTGLLDNSLFPGKMHRDTYTLHYHYQPRNDLQLDVGAYHNNTRIGLQSATNRLNMQGKAEGLHAKARQNLTTKAIKHHLIYGIEGYKKTSENLGNTGKDGHEQTASNISAYLENTMIFGKNGRFSLTPGVRYDHYTSPEFVGNKVYDEVTGALAGKIAITPNTTVFASYTQLFSGPNLPEMLINGNGKQVYVDNDLKGDKGANAEVGFSHRFKNLLAEDDRLNLNAKYFNTQFDDKVNISNTINCTTGVIEKTGQCTGYKNAGKTTIKGYEIGANYYLKNLALKTSYAHSKGELENGANLAKDTGDRINMGFDYQLNNAMTVGTNLHWVRSFERKGANNTRTYLPAYHTMDIFATYAPKSLAGSKLELGIYNIQDEYYASHESNANDKEMGRNIKASLSYQF